MKWSGEFVDGDARHKENPLSFEMPSIEARRAVRPGMFVKVGFVASKDYPVRVMASNCEGERMWVLVTDVNDGVVHGTLNNIPSLFIDLKLGDVVLGILQKHILAIDEALS